MQVSMQSFARALQTCCNSICKQLQVKLQHYAIMLNLIERSGKSFK